MRGYFIRCIAVLMTLTLINCASYQKNTKLNKYDSSIGYRYRNLDAPNKSDNSDSLFVVVSFSGGGTRAAALSYGVLEKLRNTNIVWEGKRKRLLDEVDIISSVSGGSFTAAFYGLNRDEIFNGGYENDYLKHNVEGDLKLMLLNPVNLIKLASSDYGRSDLVNEYYQENLFGKKTFADLQKMGKPFLMINGTDMTTGGQFPFIQDSFDLLCSDLSQYPVSRAVATSSAFPGLLTPLTYNNYAGGCEYIEPKWVANGAQNGSINPQIVQFIDNRRSYYTDSSYQKHRDFIHMMDGGVADNIGMRSITFGLENTGPEYGILQMINQGKIKKLILIVVNAATDPANDLDQTATLPSFTTTIISAATVPLDNYTFDTLSSTKSAIEPFTKDVKVLEDCNNALKEQCPSAKPISASPKKIDSFVSLVTFDAIADPEDRYWYKNLPTNFNLDSNTVDKLIKEGGNLLSNNNEFRQLMDEIGAK